MCVAPHEGAVFPPIGGRPSGAGVAHPSDMRFGVPKETAPGERRVALVPESCKKLITAGFEIAVEAGAGEAAGYSDDEYRAAGAAQPADPASLLGTADLVLKVTAPAASPSARDEIAWMRPVFVQAFTRDKTFQIDLEDDIQQGALITYNGEVTNSRTRDALRQKTTDHAETAA